MPHQPPQTYHFALTRPRCYTGHRRLVGNRASWRSVEHPPGWRPLLSLHCVQPSDNCRGVDVTGLPLIAPPIRHPVIEPNLARRNMSGFSRVEEGVLHLLVSFHLGLVPSLSKLRVVFGVRHDRGRTNPHLLGCPMPTEAILGYQRQILFPFWGGKLVRFFAHNTPPIAKAAPEDGFVAHSTLGR